MTCRRPCRRQRIVQRVVLAPAAIEAGAAAPARAHMRSIEGSAPILRLADASTPGSGRRRRRARTDARPARRLDVPQGLPEKNQGPAAVGPASCEDRRSVASSWQGRWLGFGLMRLKKRVRVLVWTVGRARSRVETVQEVTVDAAPEPPRLPASHTPSRDAGRRFSSHRRLGNLHARIHRWSYRAHPRCERSNPRLTNGDVRSAAEDSFLGRSKRVTAKRRRECRWRSRLGVRRCA
jgi:hypothetical protein